MALANLENGNPEEADADRSDSNNRGGEKEEDKEQEQNIVDREDLGRLDKDPVERLEDVDVAEDVSAVSTADGVLGLVNASNEHTSENDKGKYEEDEASEELQRAEKGLCPDPGLDNPMAVLTTGLGRQAFAADQSALLANKGLKLAPVPAIQSALTALAAAFKLPLALTVGLELRGSVRGKGGGRDGRCRLDHGNRQ